MENHTITINIDELDESGMSITSTMDGSTIDISTITTSTIDTTSWDLTFADDNTIDIDWATSISIESVEFEDCMPSVAKVEDMCNDYPALKQAYERFKTIYAMVHQDWKGRQDDEHFPF